VPVIPEMLCTDIILVGHKISWLVAE